MRIERPNTITGLFVEVIQWMVDVVMIPFSGGRLSSEMPSADELNGWIATQLAKSLDVDAIHSYATVTQQGWNDRRKNQEAIWAEIQSGTLPPEHRTDEDQATEIYFLVRPSNEATPIGVVWLFRHEFFAPDDSSILGPATDAAATIESLEWISATPQSQAD